MWHSLFIWFVLSWHVAMLCLLVCENKNVKSVRCGPDLGHNSFAILEVYMSIFSINHSPPLSFFIAFSASLESWKQWVSDLITTVWDMPHTENKVTAMVTHTGWIPTSTAFIPLLFFFLLLTWLQAAGFFSHHATISSFILSLTPFSFSLSLSDLCSLHSGG